MVFLYRGSQGDVQRARYLVNELSFGRVYGVYLRFRSPDYSRIGELSPIRSAHPGHDTYVEFISQSRYVLWLGQAAKDLTTSIFGKVRRDLARITRGEPQLQYPSHGAIREAILKLFKPLARRPC